VTEFIPHMALTLIACVQVDFHERALPQRVAGHDSNKDSCTWIAALPFDFSRAYS